MNLKFIRSGERKRIVRELEETFGIKKLPGVLVETGKEKIRAFSGTMNREEISELTYIANVEIIGLYIIKREHGLRLSHDATQVLGNQIDKGILEIDEGQLNDWMNGDNLDLKVDKGIYVLKCGNDFVGSGVSNGEKIFNYVPKERRVRKS